MLFRSKFLPYDFATDLKSRYGDLVEFVRKEDLDSLGINDVAQMRMTESKLMDARRMFRMLTHEGQSNVEMPLTFLQKGKEVVKQVGPPAVAYAVAGPEAAALTALAQKTPAVIRMLRGQPVQSPGTTTLNQALARTISEYMPYAEPAQFPAWNFGASVTKGVLPQQVQQGRVIVPPAPSQAPSTSQEKFSPYKGRTDWQSIDMIDPNDQRWRVPANQVHEKVQNGWTEGWQSEAGVANLGRPEAPAPDIPTVKSGYSSKQAAEVRRQTDNPNVVPASAISFGGHTAQKILPATAQAGLRMGNVMGDLPTLRQTYPQFPSPSGGRFAVTLADGETVVKYATKAEQQLAQNLVDQFKREYKQ